MNMPTHHEITSEQTPLTLAISAVKKLHAGDPDLVREGAKHHGVQVTEGGLLKPIEPHAYNFRSPEGTAQELDALAHAKKIVVGCMDYRQSDRIAKEHPEADTILFLNAGGVAQPNADRLQADTDFVAAAYKQGQEPDVHLYYHTGVCGGANHFTDGKMKQIHDDPSQGDMVEKTEMDVFGKQYTQALIDRGIPQEKLHLYRIDLDAKNAVVDIASIPVHK